MNYFFEGAFKDKDHWKKIFIIITILIAFLEFIIEGFTGVGFFGGYFYKGTLVFGSISLVVSAIKGTKAEKDKKRIPFEQNLFEGKMRAEFKNRIRKNPEFQTFCFKCSHFNKDKRICKVSFDIINKRALNTKFPGSKFEYCLYWNDNGVI